MNMKARQKHFLVALIALFAIAAALFSVNVLSTQKPAVHIYKTFTVNNATFNITALALNQSEWDHGLMNTTVTNSTIMLFEFNHSADYPFWMYDTYDGLDMIWVNYSYAKGYGQVVYIAKNATSCFVASECAVYDPHALANFVIEAKAGFTERNGISTGQRLVLS